MTVRMDTPQSNSIPNKEDLDLAIAFFAAGFATGKAYALLSQRLQQDPRKVDEIFKQVMTTLTGGTADSGNRTQQPPGGGEDGTTTPPPFKPRRPRQHGRGETKRREGRSSGNTGEAQQPAA